MNRTKFKAILLTDEENQIISHAAKKSFLTFSAYVRKAALEKADSEEA